MKSSLHQSSFVRFLIVGALSTILNYSMFLSLFNILNISYDLAYVIGFLSGLFLGFFLNKAWAFQFNATVTLRILMLYVTVYAISLVIGLVCIRILVEGMSFGPIEANIGVIMLTTFINYFGVRFWAFKT